MQIINNFDGFYQPHDQDKKGRVEQAVEYLRTFNFVHKLDVLILSDSRGLPTIDPNANIYLSKKVLMTICLKIF